MKKCLVWNAREIYSAEAMRSAGEHVIRITAGYLLRLAKYDPKCTRRDERRACVPIATQTHGALWRAALDWSAALPGDTDQTRWAEAVDALIDTATATAKARADKARAARAEKKAAAKTDEGEGAEGEGAEGTVETDPQADIAAAAAALIAAIMKLPPADRPAAARRVASEIVGKFE